MPSCSGFTALSCLAPGCGRGDAGTVADPLLDALRAAVAASVHGVLVSTGCLLGAGVCAGRPAAPVVVVQPCDPQRAPTTGAHLIGPLRTGADVDAVAAWLRAGTLDPAELPPHLFDLRRRVETR